MHTVADIFYLILAILFAVLMVRAAFGLLPRSNKRVWSFRATGYKNVGLSGFSLVSIILGYFGVVVAFGSAAFALETAGIIGLFIALVGFVLVSLSWWRDIRRFRQQRLAESVSISVKDS
jgi:hypothetical protein